MLHTHELAAWSCLAGVLADGLPSNGGGHEPLDRDAWSSEAKFLLLLSAPACVQLCTQQGLVVTNQVRLRSLPHAS